MTLWLTALMLVGAVVIYLLASIRRLLTRQAYALAERYNLDSNFRYESLREIKWALDAVESDLSDIRTKQDEIVAAIENLKPPSHRLE